MMTALKLIALTIAIWFGYINVAQAAHRQSVPAINCIIMGASMAAFAWAMGWLG